MSLENTINQDIKTAMLAKKEADLRALRAVKSALLLAKTEKGASENITEEAEIKVLQKLVKQRRESAEIYKGQNREDLYQIEMEEIEVIERYLPSQMTPTELEEYLRGLMVKLNVTSIKEIGKVMGIANKELAGKADGRAISETIKNLLG
ncbi:GatB/YqeY domain-containing protein [Pseudopedobacter saltans DSM 12145]|uniref:GatB/YqeY domain-containing protein n=1 Tax=Pseudopedobacter saltans (strain ATCC 51119 / DSM 12145 / JCM 21818 / CCUG 39354 / LMG 10337 / NBRC 100064 / NCIMB 13643) TaxID=762903 RepID=F0S9V6_PSESL|nr:GatB/YqeY domain-containing protein [Pseudopedobacter saltans]ADY52514.1 GatB/YqeY domain-containing protein [Pseudopedobacter saltans DSM 12145]